MPAAPPAITTIDEARSLRANGKLDEYEAALRMLSSSEDAVTKRRALALLGIFEIEQKKWDLAVPALMQAADSYPEVAPFLRIRVAAAEEQRGNVPAALNAATQVIATAPDSSAATMARLRLPAWYAATGDTASAEAAYKITLSIPIDEVSEGDFVELASRLEKAGRADLATAVRMRLLTEFTQGRYTEQTYGHVTSVLETLSFDDSLSLVNKLAREDRYDQALDLMARMERRFPAQAPKGLYRLTRARALFNSRHYTDLLNETAGQKIDDPAVLLLRARAAWRSGKSDEFLAGLEQIEKEFPASKEAVEAKLQRAKYYATDEPKWDVSLANLQAAIDAGALGNDGENLWTLGWTQMRAGKTDDALRTFDLYLQKYADGDYRTNSLFWSAKIGRPEDRDAKFGQLIAEYPYSYYAYRAKEIMGAVTPSVSEGPGGVGGTTNASSITSLAPPSPPGPSLTLGATRAFPDLTPPPEPRLDVVNELASLDLMRDAVREMKLAVAAHPESLGLQFQLADLYVRGGEPFKANGILQRRFRDFVRHGGTNIPDRFWQILFPLNYWDTIREEAGNRGVDPYLLASIIRQESGFEPSTVSNAGAVGLMQIMPAEAEMIANKAGLAGVTRESLFDPKTNIAIGAAEYSQKLELENSNPILAIAAYNAGEQAVGNWLARTPVDDIDLFIDSIPYAETKLYVKTVNRNRFEYRRIYEGNAVPSQQQTAR